MKNYICFGGLIKLHYAYVDTRDYLADPLLRKHEVGIRFGDEYAKPNEEFKIIFCKVKKKHKHQFEKAMNELVDKMLICGHSRYESFCDYIMSELSEFGEED